jgi:phage shock protein B
MDGLIPIVVVALLFIGLPWLILHYVTKWKQSSALSQTDEKLLDELFDFARRLDKRMETLERIIDENDPNWKYWKSGR